MGAKTEVKAPEERRFPVPTQGSVHLDALRGTAALLVLLNHTRALYFSSFIAATVASASSLPMNTAAQTTGTEGELKIASSAVIVFFVLSGYLVGGSVLRGIRSGRWSWKDYLAKRLVRLLIVLVPAVLLGAALDHLGSRLFGPGSIYTAPAGLDLVVSADLAQRLKPAVLLGNVVFLQGILVPTEGTNVALWSLSYEFWYYIAFPLAVLSFQSKSPWYKRLVVFLGACLTMAFAGSHIAASFPIWLMGAAVSLAPPALTRRRAARASLLAASVLICVIATLRLLHVRALRAEYLIAGVSTVLLYTLIGQTGPARDGAYRRVSAFFSRISYSLYLFHLPLAVFLCGLVDSPWRPHLKTPRNLGLFGLSDIAILGAVYLLWLMFERNTDRLREFLFKVRRAKPSLPQAVTS